MFKIQKRLQSEGSGGGGSANKPVDLRQKLLQKEFENLKQLPLGCSIHFDNPDILYVFKLNVVPDKDSLWHTGKYEFVITVPEGYNFEVCFRLLFLCVFNMFLNKKKIYFCCVFFI